MPLLNWQPSLEVGCASIDREHQKLVEILNALQESAEFGKGRTLLEEGMDELLLFAAEHFAREEEALRQAGYAGFAGQIRNHADLLSNAWDFREDFKKGKFSLDSKQMKFLKEWVLQHIRSFEGPLGDFLRARRVELSPEEEDKPGLFGRLKLSGGKLLRGRRGGGAPLDTISPPR